MQSVVVLRQVNSPDCFLRCPPPFKSATWMLVLSVEFSVLTLAAHRSRRSLLQYPIHCFNMYVQNIWAQKWQSGGSKRTRIIENDHSEDLNTKVLMKRDTCETHFHAGLFLVWQKIICSWLVLETTSGTVLGSSPGTAMWSEDLSGNTQLGRNYCVSVFMSDYWKRREKIWGLMQKPLKTWWFLLTASWSTDFYWPAIWQVGFKRTDSICI